MQLHEFFASQKPLPSQRGKRRPIQSPALDSISTKKVQMNEFKSAGNVLVVGRVEHTNRKIELCLLCGTYQARGDVVSNHIRESHFLEWNDFWSLRK